MKVRILEDFTGYPDDTAASETHYRAGAEEVVTTDFGKLLIAKGHAEAIGKQASADQPEATSNDQPEQDKA